MDFYSGPKDSDNTYMTKEEVFRALKTMGIDKAVVEFSGGYDEGGADSIKLYKGEKVAQELQEYIWGYEEDENGQPVYEDYQAWDGNTYKKPKPRPLTKEEEAEMRLAQSLAAPVYDKYCSFAGEFSVSGNVTWDVTTNHIVMDGDESMDWDESQYVPFTEEL